MKKNEISAKFATIVADAIAEGFAPCMTELCGSYSGVVGSQIVLAKGNERIVMWMEEEHAWEHKDTEIDAIALFASRFALAKGERTDHAHMWPSDWKRDAFHTERVYRVSEWRGDWYSEDKAEAERAQEKRYTRHSHFGSSDWREYEVDDRLLAIARRIKGFKTIRRENLRVVKNHGTWTFVNKKSRNEVRIGA